MWIIKIVNILLFLILFLPDIISAQGRNNLWLLGYQSGQIGPTTTLRANVDFSSGNAVVSPVTRKMKLKETQGNISDSNGNNAILRIYNSVGEIIGKRAAQVYGGYVTQDVYIAELPSGMYVVRLETEKEVYVGKFVKE
jgi:hypothetical protein